MTEPAKPVDHMAEDMVKEFPIVIGEEDILPPVAAGSYMINRTGEFNAKRASHSGRLAVAVGEFNIQDLTPAASANGSKISPLLIILQCEVYLP